MNLEKEFLFSFIMTEDPKFQIKSYVLLHSFTDENEDLEKSLNV